MSDAANNLVATPPAALADWFATDYLHGDRFAALADVRIDKETHPIPDQVLHQGRIIYCMIDRAPELLRILHRRTAPCVLVTHNGDHNVTPQLLASKPFCVRHWFAQNACVESADVTPIPIGLERPLASAGRTHPDIFQAAARDAGPIKNLAYLNYSDWTNRRERTPLRGWLGWRSWVTNRTAPTPFPTYLQDVARHRSVISPPGRGVDCHRTWEALYLGAIPIVRRGPAMNALARLFPIVRFDTIVTLTQRGVEEQIARVKAPQGWQEHLRFSWWERHILRKCGDLCG